MNPELLKKLQKLLNLGKSSNENESQLAIQKAQQIAADYGIDLACATVMGEETEKIEIIEDKINMGRRKSITQRFTTQILQEFFNVKIIYSGGRYGGCFICIIGDKRDVEFATYINSFLNERMLLDWRYYAKSNSISTKARGSYLYGYRNGLISKLNEAKTKNQNEKFETIPTIIRNEAKEKFAIMISDKKNMIQDFIGRTYPILRHSSRSSVGCDSNSSSYSTGFQTGRNLNINRPIGGTLALN